MKTAGEAPFGWSTLAALGAYALLLAAYLIWVLRLLAQPLHWLRQHQAPLYWVAALPLILAQAVLLEFVAGHVLRCFARWRPGARPGER